MSTAPPVPGADAELARWAARVLDGTGLTMQDAAVAAADPAAAVPPAAARAAQALRDGWAAAKGDKSP
jgi:hypothetical protein